MLKDNARVLRSVLDTLKAKVYPCMQGDFSLDIIGKFYSEFLRYAKGDQSSGIVLTPPHITELFLCLNSSIAPTFFTSNVTRCSCEKPLAEIVMLVIVIKINNNLMIFNKFFLP